MREVLLAANWKMNTTPNEAQALVTQILPELGDITDIEILLCPPFISTLVVADLLKGTPLKLGAQNCYYEDKGAFTGEISPAMIAETCQYVILGHSERRTIFGESSQIVNLKIKAALKHNIKPILCIGESLDEHENASTEEVLTTQLTQSLADITSTDVSSLVIAYEPIWAIGTGRAASGEQANTTIGMIRQTLSGIFGVPTALTTRILYGGSANSSNITEFIGQLEIDGALVGGAALKADEFVSMIKQALAVIANKA